MNVYEIVSCPTTELSYTNKAIINEADDFSKIEHIIIKTSTSRDVYVFSLIVSNKVKLGQLAFNLSGRKWARLQTGDKVQAAPYKFEPKSQCLNSITFYTDYQTRKVGNEKYQLVSNEMSTQFSSRFSNQAFTVGQIVGFIYEQEGKKHCLELKVKELAAMNMRDTGDIGTTSVEIGLTTPNTVAIFERGESASINIVGTATGKTPAQPLLGLNFNLSSMGIGGLSKQFEIMLRRAFCSRLVPPHIAEDMCLQHIKGILLYGPPGTGKTLLARQIGQMLHARPPKIVNGPEVFNKFVGESEANIRRLFEDAEKEQKSAGSSSALHLIIMDEIDAICRARGTTGSSTGTGDNLVNQLLSKIDGVDSLNNVLLIGMTNRRDAIDDALLRPGRLEVQLEIGLPDEHGRYEILSIHLKPLQKRNRLSADVDPHELARITRNFTGAELAGLIRAAQSYAIRRVTETGENITIDPEAVENININRADFQQALDQDIKPALGACEDEMNSYAERILYWHEDIHQILAVCKNSIEMVKTTPFKENASRGTIYPVIFLGNRGSGLTTLASNVALLAGFPYTRIYQPSNIVGMTEMAKVNSLAKLFNDASMSELSCIILDDLDEIVEFNQIGMRYSAPMLNALKSNMKTKPPKNHGILLLCTCTSEIFLKDFDLLGRFKKILEVPSITNASQVETILNTIAESGQSFLNNSEIDQICAVLKTKTMKFGIKHLLDSLEAAEFDDSSQRVSEFLSRLRIFIRSKSSENTPF